MPQNGSDEVFKMLHGLPATGGPFGQRRKAQTIGPPQPGQQLQQQPGGYGGGEFDPMGGGHNPMMMMGGDQPQLPRPAWSSFDGGRAMKLPPLEVCLHSQ